MRKFTAAGEGIAPIFVSPAQAAEALGVSLWSINQLIQAGELVSAKHGTRRLVKVDSLHAYADRLVERSA